MSEQEFKQGDIVRFKGGQDEWRVVHRIGGFLYLIRMGDSEIDANFLCLEFVRRPKKKVQKKGWVNVYRSSAGGVQITPYPFSEKQQADEANYGNRIDCVQITWTEEVEP